MIGRLYAIGDIHGHYTELAAMMKRLDDDGMDPGRDQVIFLGDYIDRGPHARDVVDLVKTWTSRHPHWRALRGNHEQMMLDALRTGPEDWGTWTTWWYQGGRETAASFAGVPVRDVEPIHTQSAAFPRELVAWIHGLPYMVVQNRYAFVHAGVRPVPVWQFDTDRHDMIWIRDEFLESDFDFGRIIVHGHTPAEEPEVRPNRIGIDTILRGGYLTAVELSGQEPRFIRSDRGG